MKTRLLSLCVVLALCGVAAPAVHAAQAIKDLTLSGTTTNGAAANNSGAHVFLSGASATFAAGSTLTINGVLAGTPTSGTLNLSALSLTLPTSQALTTPALGAATATSLAATGIVSAKATTTSGGLFFDYVGNGSMSTATPTAWASGAAIPRMRLNRGDLPAAGGGVTDFQIVPYEYGTALEYNGTLEAWVDNFSVKGNRAGAPGEPPNLWVGNNGDTGGLRATAQDAVTGNALFAEIASEKFAGTSGGNLRFRVVDAADKFQFRAGSAASHMAGSDPSTVVAEISGAGLGTFTTLKVSSSGATVARILTHTEIVAVGTINTMSSTNFNVTVAGAVIGDTVHFSRYDATNLDPVCIYTALVSAPNTVLLTVGNPTAGNRDQGNVPLRFTVIGY